MSVRTESWTRPRIGAVAAARSTRARGTVLLLVAVGLFACYFLLPLVWLLIGATKSNAQLVGTPGFLPAFPTSLRDNLVGVLTDGGGIYLRWMGNSIFYSLTAALGSTFLCALAGFAFAKYRFRGANIMFAAVLGSVMVPNTALVLPIYLLVNEAHLVNTPWAVILPQLVNPVGLFLCRLFWNDSVPDELIDAGRIDGASDLRIFWSIGIPLMRNGLVTVALLAFVGVWNNFFLPIVVLSHSDLFPVVQGLASWNLEPASGITVQIGVVLLGSLISIIPLIAAFLGLARYWQAGLTIGATKS